ncbi:MAG: heparan-alpha-glucosaminide N-acetyltransferase domain-containing protein [Nibricoccus sp.]
MDTSTLPTPTNLPESTAPSRAPRIESVDLLRGLVMVIMALDHVRHFFHEGALHRVNPLDLAQTSEALFFTRWITHFCAPIFSFLAGTAVFLAAQRGKSKGELAWFLFTRGLWLVFLDLTLLGWFGWRFSIDVKSYNFSTLWALGGAMIALSALIRLPVWAVTTIGLVLIGGHNAFDGVKPESLGSFSWLWSFLHVTGQIKTSWGISMRIGYPVLPWIGVMAAGYGMGVIYKWDAAARQRWLIRVGCGMIVGFVALRLANVYGNLTPWATQSRPTLTVMSFLDCTKYPPSLCFVLMTIGPGLIALALLERPWSKRLQPLLVYGQVPFFYYIIHIPLIHALAMVACQICFGTSAFLIGRGVTAPPDVGFGLPVVYAVWISVVVALYPACRWFAALKRRHRAAWMSYF